MAHNQMNWIKRLNLTILLGVLGASLQAQIETQEKIPGDASQIFTESFLFESDLPNKTRMDIYVQVPYPEISFVKEEELYSGRFELSAAVLTQEKQEVWQKSQTVELKLKNFSQTVSPRLSSLKQFSADLSPGSYELLVQVTDQDSKKVITLRKALVVRELKTNSLALSDLMLVYRMAKEGVHQSVVPNLTGILEKDLGVFFLFFEISNPTQLDSVRLLCKFVNSQQNVIAQYQKVEMVSEKRTQVVWQIDTPMFATDHYSINVEAEGYSKINQGNTLHASVSRGCLVRNNNLPMSISSIDKATDQLQYIAKESEIDFIREAKSPEEKLKRFREFWSKHNPSPNSTRNDLMTEYYLRVAYADKNYSSYLEGWKTDRGMVYILFGPPQNVDRHPFDSESKPYEIWYYYDQNREFVFVDETGFGDYRLRYPSTDLWGRIR